MSITPTQIICGISIVITILIIRIFTVLQQIKSKSRNSGSTTSTFKQKRNRPVKTLVVLGSGGHTTEMLHLLSSITITNHDNYKPLNYIIASTDTTSTNRLAAFNAALQKATSTSTSTIQSQALPPYIRICKIPRAREVGQSYFTSIFTTIYSILYTAHIVLIQTQPDLLLLNGPGTCLPIALWTFIARVLGLCQGNIVFCESFCRVKSLSLTGNILRKMGIVDLFLVHWPELLDKRKKDEKDMVLIDSFIRHS